MHGEKRVSATPKDVSTRDSPAPSSQSSTFHTHVRQTHSQNTGQVRSARSAQGRYFPKGAEIRCCSHWNQFETAWRATGRLHRRSGNSSDWIDRTVAQALMSR
jgi:hypothetical protein